MTALTAEAQGRVEITKEMSVNTGIYYTGWNAAGHGKAVECPFVTPRLCEIFWRGFHDRRLSN